MQNEPRNPRDPLATPSPAAPTPEDSAPPPAATAPETPASEEDGPANPAWAADLRQLYDAVVDEPLPDSILDLLSQLDTDD